MTIIYRRDGLMATSVLSDDELNRLLRSCGPMNLPRAQEIMDRFGLEGLVLGEPVNVFHALGYWPQIANTKMAQPPTSFALVSRRPDTPVGFVTTRFIYYYTFADGRFARHFETWLYEETGDACHDAPIGEFAMFPDLGSVPPSEIESRRAEAMAQLPSARRTVRDAGGALVQAMRALGLWGSRVAFDHPVIAEVCARHGNPGTLIPADNILRSIRIVKSPLEIALMRRASAANIAALQAVIQGIRAGAEHRDLRRLFELEAVRGGNRPVFLTVDRVSSELADERILAGQMLFVDGVSHFRQYHGDYARTVFVGEPGPAARRATAAMVHGWQAVRDRLKPGLRYSEIVRIGREAIASGGFDVTVGFGPHSVGLMHTDEPCEEAGGFYRKADLALEENMILSVDCPVLATGIGGSAHMEDLMLITARGAEPIHPLAEPVVYL